MAAGAQVLPIFLRTLSVLLPLLAVRGQSVNNCWPRCMYGLPKAGSGCPGSCSEFIWEEGYRLFEAEYASYREAPNLSGIFLQDESQIQFCMKSSTSVCLDCPLSDWPDGSYCIYRHQSEDCPSGFMQGSVALDSTVRATNCNQNGGSVPAGVYTSNHTRLEFCCKQSNISRSSYIVLPSNRAFYLMAAQNGSCQNVQGMSVTEEVLIWSGVSGNITGPGAVPKGSLENDTLELVFCYYRPVPSIAVEPPATGTSDCEGVFEYRNAYIAGVSVLCTILVVMAGSLVVGFGLCSIARRRTKQADIMTHRLNELQLLIERPYTAVKPTAVAAGRADAQEVPEVPDRFSYPFFRAQSYSRPMSIAHPREQRVRSNHFYENLGLVQVSSAPARLTAKGKGTEEEEEEEGGALPEEFQTPALESTYEKPVSTEEDLIQQLSEMIIKCETLSKPVPLGSGRFGHVIKAMWKSPTGDLEVAAKKLREGAIQEERIRFLQEAAIMRQFNHPNVVNIEGVVIDYLTALQSKEIIIVMELMVNGDLQQYLHKLKTASSKMVYREASALLLRFAKEIASGMDYLSSKKFVHRDLAARNILLDANYVCKISDFGLARDMEDSQYYSAADGLIPLKWTAPEALGYKKYSTASDVWSYGCVLYELWSLGEKPLSQWTIQEFYCKLLEGHRQPPPAGCPRGIYQLMMDCWHPRPRERPTFSAISYTLRQPSDHLLQLSDTDTRTASTQASLLGADSAVGTGMYVTLQKMYLNQ